MDIRVHLRSKILTESLVCLLSSQTTHSVKGFTSCEERHSPDLVICDGSNCREDGMCRWPDSRVILIDTGIGETEVFSYVVSRSIDGVLTTDMSPEMVGKAIAAVVRGDFWMPHDNVRKILFQAGAVKTGRRPALSEKHRRIVELISLGCKNREIAEDLHLSEQTVKSHVSLLLRLLNVSNRTQIARLVLDNRL